MVEYIAKGDHLFHLLATSNRSRFYQTHMQDSEDVRSFSIIINSLLIHCHLFYFFCLLKFQLFHLYQFNSKKSHFHNLFVDRPITRKILFTTARHNAQIYARRDFYFQLEMIKKNVQFYLVNAYEQYSFYSSLLKFSWIQVTFF